MVNKLMWLARLVVAMSRPPVALILLLFAAIGAVDAGSTLQPSWLLLSLAAIVVLGLINAAALNDLADEQIDKVNLLGSSARPLANNQASRRQILALAVLAAIMALVISFLISPALGLITALGIGFNWTYSMPPLRVLRTQVAPFLLPLAYVTTPFLIGLVGSGHSLDKPQLVLLAGLYSCFVGRILLKDFRDTKGDAMFGKLTFLLRYGRGTTCLTSAAFWLMGAVILALGNSLFAPLFVIYLPLIFAGLYFLHVARGNRAEQIIIWSIARVGSGLAVTIFTGLQLQGRSLALQAIAALGIAVPFVGLYLSSLRLVVQVKRLRLRLPTYRIFVHAAKNLPAPLREPFW